MAIYGGRVWSAGIALAAAGENIEALDDPEDADQEASTQGVVLLAVVQLEVGHNSSYEEGQCHQKTHHSPSVHFA